MAHPKVPRPRSSRVPDEKWGERPLRVRGARATARSSTPTSCAAFLAEPRRQVVAARRRRVHRRGARRPRSGKFAKKALRERFAAAGVTHRLVVSDLHLGARSERRPAAPRRAARAAARGARGRRPPGAARRRARAARRAGARGAARRRGRCFEELGRGARPDARGRARARQPRPPADRARGSSAAARPAPPPLGLERARSSRREASPLAAAIWRGGSRPRRSSVAYPGLWLRDDVYATHGHYLDRHVTVPASSAWRRVVERSVASRRPADALARRGLRGRRSRRSTRCSTRSRSPRAATGAARRTRTPRSARLARRSPATAAPAAAPARCSAGLPGSAIGALNRVGLGPLRADLRARAAPRGPATRWARSLRRARRRAAHVVFGHTHRAGPLAERRRRPSGRAGRRAHRQHRLVGLRAAVPDRAGPAQPVLAGHGRELGDDGAPRPRACCALLGDAPATDALSAAGARPGVKQVA